MKIAAVAFIVAIAITALPVAAEVVYRQDVSSWQIVCDKDAMTDDVACSLSEKNATGLLVIAPHIIAIGGARGGDLLLRLDQQPPRPFKCCRIEDPIAAELIDGMRRAKQLRVRHTDAAGHSTDFSFDLTGLVPAIVERDAACRRLKARC